MTNILRIDSSTRGAESASASLTAELATKLAGDNGTIQHRKLDHNTPLLSETITAQLGSSPADRTADAADALGFADELIAEIESADVLIIGAPIYNFGVPASLKAWADLISQAGRTFNYTETGPVGKLADRPTYIVYAAGGVPAGSPVDHSTTWTTQFLNFLGITNVTVIAAEGLATDPETGMANAKAAIAAI